jgi:hypothetical protein
VLELTDYDPQIGLAGIFNARVTACVYIPWRLFFGLIFPTYKDSNVITALRTVDNLPAMFLDDKSSWRPKLGQTSQNEQSLDPPNA